MGMKPEDLFLQNLDLIDRIAAFVSRRNHVPPCEAEDFNSHVRFKLIEGNYAIIRKFEGRSTFATYLTTVIQRLYFQYRVQMWGKWRPSAEAKRIGDKGIAVERLLTRDGYTYGEVIEMLTTGATPAFTRREIEAIHARLPLRQPRPVLVAEAASRDVPGRELPDAGLFGAERQHVAREAYALLDRAFGDLSNEERMILRMRYASSLKVPEIATALSLDTKKLYKRIEKMLVSLRGMLERAGIDRRVVDDILNVDEVPRTRIAVTEGKSAVRLSHQHDGGYRRRRRDSR
jgi:RNA polymerase sigma factor for flagellar operon FliA